MGLASFTELVHIAGGREAFVHAHREARRKYGNGNGTIAEKRTFKIVADAPMHPDAAQALALKMMDEQRHDRRGPALAIPVTTGTRTEKVQGFSYTSKDNLVGVVTPLLSLARGESVRNVRTTYSEYTKNGPFVQHENCTAEVTIDLGLTRTVDVEVRIPAGPATDDGFHIGGKFTDAVQEAARKKVRLRKGEKFLFGSVRGFHRVAAAAKSKAIKGKAVTRYLVHGVNGPGRRNTWKDGFDTQAQARAWAIEALESERSSFYGPVTITAETRREGGDALVTLYRPLRKVEATVTATIATAKAQPTEPDAWLFFGSTRH